MKIKNVVLLATIFQGNITNVFCDSLRSRAIKGERDLQQVGRKQAPPGYNNASKEGMRLRYGSLEGPENGVYVRGKSKEKVILLPDYWPDLIHEDSITVQLTAIGSGQELYVEKIEDNKVYVNGDNYFYYIQAERKDVERFEVEYEV